VKHVIVLLACTATGLVTLAACGHNAGPAHPVNTLCTPAAASAFNAYWQEQVDSASIATVQEVITVAMAATQARINLCEGK
jgi:hypothetical protein